MIDERELINFLKQIEGDHPYKVFGNPDTYSQYNEAWQDCVDRVEAFVSNFHKEDQQKLRPCKFYMDWTTESVRNISGEISVNVIREGKICEGYFHKFTDSGKGIVEHLNGEVCEVSADSIVFTDRDCKE